MFSGWFRKCLGKRRAPEPVLEPEENNTESSPPQTRHCENAGCPGGMDVKTKRNLALELLRLPHLPVLGLCTLVSEYAWPQECVVDLLEPMGIPVVYDQMVLGRDGRLWFTSLNHSFIGLYTQETGFVGKRMTVGSIMCFCPDQFDLNSFYLATNKGRLFSFHFHTELITPLVGSPDKRSVYARDGIGEEAIFDFTGRVDIAQASKNKVMWVSDNKAVRHVDIESRAVTTMAHSRVSAGPMCLSDDDKTLYFIDWVQSQQILVRWDTVSRAVIYVSPLTFSTVEEIIQIPNTSKFLLRHDETTISILDETNHSSREIAVGHRLEYNHQQTERFQKNPPVANIWIYGSMDLDVPHRRLLTYDAMICRVVSLDLPHEYFPLEPCRCGACLEVA